MAKKKQEMSSEELLEQALVREEDWPYQVPENWVWVKFKLLAEGQHGAAFKSTEYSTIGIPIIRMGNVVNTDTVKLTDKLVFIPNERLNEFKKFIINNNDIVMTMTDLATKGEFLGTVAIYKSAEIALLNQRLLKINFNKQVMSYKFLFYSLRNISFRNYITQPIGGSIQKNISADYIFNYNFPLPPLAEQQRIVDRIESLFAKLDQAKDLIQEALDSFETRKAAILHQAFTGELTKKWREAHSNMRNTTLYDIKEYAEGLPKKQKNQILNAQEFVKIKELNDGNIWYECTIGAAGLVTNGSTPSRACLEYWNGDIPWVSSGEVRNNIIDFSKECITQNGYENSSVKLLPKGTVLIAMIGEGKTRGQSAVLDISATTNQNIAAIIIDHGYISSNFLWYWLQKEYQNNREKGNGTGPQALNCQRVRELKFVLPSFLEQQEIVRILDVLFAKEQNAKDLIDLIDQIEAIKKTILGQAFRGELGTNEAGEESAMELLKDVLMSK